MKLPVLHIVAAAYGALLARPAPFITGMIPALVMIVALWSLLLVSGPPDAAVWHLWKIIHLLPYIAFGLIWLRLLLHDAGLSPRPLARQQCALYAIVGGLLLLLLWLPVSEFLLQGIATFLETGRAGWRLTQPESSVYLAGLALLPPWSYLFARMSLLAPAAAVAQPLTLRAVWIVTKGNGLRLVAAYLLAGLPLLTAVLAIQLALLDSLPHPDGYPLNFAIADVFNAPLRLAAVAVFVAVLAEAYRLMPGAPSARNQVRLRFE